MNDSAPLLEVSGLVKTFATGEGAIDVLCDLELRLGRGEMIAILGESGVGKSTLLHVLGTLDHPSAGSVRFEGRDLFAEPPDALARFRNECLGFVFQFHHLLPEFSAVENVMMPGLLRGLAPGAVRPRAEAILEEVGLSSRLRHPVGKLADEPTGNLDPVTGERVAELLLDLNRTRGAALVVVTHSLDLAARLGRAERLVHGRLRPEALPSAPAPRPPTEPRTSP